MADEIYERLKTEIDEWNIIRKLKDTCKGTKRESNITWKYGDYTIYYDIFANEFWSNRTMEKKYKTKVQERIDERTAYSIVVASKKTDDSEREFFDGDWDYFSSYYSPNMLAELIEHVPRILLCDEYAREALREGVPIADIIA